MLFEWLQDAVNQNIIQELKAIKPRPTRKIPRQLMNIEINTMVNNQPYLRGGQTLEFGGKIYKGGQFLPKQVHGRFKGRYFTT